MSMQQILGKKKIMEQVPQPPLNEHRESLENPHLLIGDTSTQMVVFFHCHSLAFEVSQEKKSLQRLHGRNDPDFCGEGS